MFEFSRGKKMQVKVRNISMLEKTLGKKIKFKGIQNHI
jgi:hypothetical protein